MERASAPRRVLVVGTGTDVGKTHVTCALLAELRRRGARAAALKAVATGAPDGIGEDARLHARALGEASPRPPVFAYARPVSPHVAAREEERPIDLGRIVSAVRALEADHDVIVVEGAGGLFSPFAPALTHVDLAKALAPVSLVVVAPDRLGVLHDLTACRLAAAQRGLAAARFVLSAPERADASTGENAREAAASGAAHVAAVFPREAIDTTESRTAAAALLAALDLRFG